MEEENINKLLNIQYHVVINDKKSSQARKGNRVHIFVWKLFCMNFQQDFSG